MGNSPPPPPNPDDYSAATTLITFQRPLPLLRQPIKAGPSDDPSSGPHLLAFKNPRDWAAAYISSKAQLISQCESGARIGCSISASNKCKPPWWKFLLGLSSKQDLSERAKCEEIEMEACFSEAKERCVVFAKQKCEPAFKHAKIQASSLDLGVKHWREVFILISGVCYLKKRSYGFEVWEVDKSWGEIRRKNWITNVRGTDLLGEDNKDIEDYFTKNN